MKHLLPLIALLLTIGHIQAQDSYKGKYSETATFIEKEDFLPIGKHTSYDDDQKLKLTVWYTKSGWAKKIKSDKNGAKKIESFPKNIEEVEWKAITEGVWINKISESETLTTAFEGKQDVKLHYIGYLLDGQVFDNSFIRNTPLPGKLSYFIKGFAIGVGNMNAGEMRLIKIAPEMGYDDKKAGNVPPNSTLIYAIYLVE